MRIGTFGFHTAQNAHIFFSKTQANQHNFHLHSNRRYTRQATAKYGFLGDFAQAGVIRGILHGLPAFLLEIGSNAGIFTFCAEFILKSISFAFSCDFAYKSNTLFTLSIILIRSNMKAFRHQMNPI